MDGGVEERFNDALAKVWENVYDPNTEARKAREVVMKVKIIPNERRDSCDFRVDVVPKLAPPVSLSQTVMLNIGTNGEIVATERTDQIPGQFDIDGNEAPIPRTVQFPKVERA
jgi:hypothetical protein